MISTLLFTIVVEGIIALAYSIWRRKPVVPLLLTSVIANLLTQSLLWIALRLFFSHYLITLLITEIFIWLIESACLRGVCFNQLSAGEALFLSLIMNASSVALGWLLPL